eukprot:scaffold1770_cov375-Prasinococcus_capsulatus_cf.AAC.19
MLRLVGAMDKQKYTPRTYVVAATDRLSAEKAVRLEGDRKDYTLEVSKVILPLMRVQPINSAVQGAGRLCALD